MSKKNISFEDKENKTNDLYKNKKVVKMDDIDVSLLTKYQFLNDEYQFDNDVIRLLCITLPQMTGYVRKFEGNTTISFKISDKQLLKKYNQTWKKLKNY